MVLGIDPVGSERGTPAQSTPPGVPPVNPSRSGVGLVVLLGRSDADVIALDTNRIGAYPSG